MYEFETLPQALEAAAGTSATITFVEGVDNQTQVPVSELRTGALAMLGRLQRHGLTPGDELIVHVTDNRTFLEAFWACLIGGIVPVPLAQGISDEHRFKLLRVFDRLARPTLFTESRTLDRLRGFASASGRDDGFAAMEAGALVSDAAGGQAGEPEVPGVPAPGIDSSSLAFVQFSSGSTSEPKGVMLTHGNVLTNLRAIIAGIQGSAEDTTLSWMPLSHDMGMIGFHLVPVVAGMNQVLIPTDVFVRRPSIWVLKASELAATLLCSPNFGYKHLLKAIERRDPGPFDLSSVRMLLNGAEPISVGLCAQFLDRMSAYGLRPETMFPVYGLAEASVAVSFPEIDSGVRAVHVERASLAVGAAVEHLSSGDPGAVPFPLLGRAISDCEIRITDGDGSTLADDVVGHVEIRGGNVTTGYYRDEASTGAALRGDGWLDTGDLGFLVEGELVITGRHKDIIFSNGQNFFPHDLEGILERETGLELGKVAVAGHRFPDAEADDVLVFVVHKGELDSFVPLVGDITATLNAQMGIDVTHVVPIQRLPKTTSGKVQRARLARSYEEGEFAAQLAELERLRPNPAEPADAGDSAEHGSPAPGGGGTSAESVAATLLELCSTILPGRSVGPDDNLFEIGTSSVELAQIHEGIEKAFPGVVDITDLFDYPTVTELSAFLEGKLG